MAKRKQPSELKVSVTFTPVVDWESRLKRVMELLLQPVSDQPNDGEVKLITEAKGETKNG